MQIETYWNSYLKALPSDVDKNSFKYEAWHFCINRKDADNCAELVLQGVKTATTSLYWEYKTQDESLPKIGDLDIITDWNNNPICIIQTTEVNIIPYNQVDEQFAFDEGEGDQSLASWRKVHWKVLTDTCYNINRRPSEDMPLVCARFKVIYK